MDVLQQISSWIWGIPSMVLLVGTGLYFTIRLRGLQFRRLKQAFRLALTKSEHGKGEISSFQMLMTSLAATIGNGNIAGIAVALTMGGPGAVFWMWVIGLIGMATKYAESLLAILYRERNDRGEVVSGPMYYIEKGLGKGFKPLAVAFALFGLIASFGVGNTVQANAMSTVLNQTFNVPLLVFGVILAVAVYFSIRGGLERVSSISTIFVPLMSLLYICAALLILVIQADQVLPALGLIVQYAFEPLAPAGAFTGISIMVAMQVGVARGIFTNEAGLGTAALIAGSAKSERPAEQGLISMTSTFIVTIIVCTMTALVLMTTGFWDPTGGELSGVAHDASLSGAALTSAAFTSVLGSSGAWIVAFSVFFFGYSTIIGWYVYGEKCLEYLSGATRFNEAYRIVFAVAACYGAVANLEPLWLVADIANGLMMIPNLIGMLLLSKIVIDHTKQYEAGTIRRVA